jgi:hypothetical protein
MNTRGAPQPAHSRAVCLLGLMGPKMMLLVLLKINAALIFSMPRTDA